MPKVSDIDAEYFPPKEDIILQNEAPTDLYILVSGSVVSELYWLSVKKLFTLLPLIKYYSFVELLE